MRIKMINTSPIEITAERFGNRMFIVATKMDVAASIAHLRENSFGAVKHKGLHTAASLHAARLTSLEKHICVPHEHESFRSCFRRGKIHRALAGRASCPWWSNQHGPHMSCGAFCLVALLAVFHASQRTVSFLLLKHKTGGKCQKIHLS